MKVIANATVLIVFLGLGFSTLQIETACAQSNTQSENITPLDLAGIWRTKESTARFRMFPYYGKLMIEGWNNTDYEPFEISNISLEGKTLRFTSRLPSTNWTVHHQCIIINYKEMVVYQSGPSTKPDKFFKE